MTVISLEELRAIKVALTDDCPYVDRISFALVVRLFEMRSSLREQALVIDELGRFRSNSLITCVPEIVASFASG